MLRAFNRLNRAFSGDFRHLRQLNREMRFEEVVEEYKQLSLSTKEPELTKCKEQYIYALTSLKLLQQNTSPQLIQGQNMDNPLFYKEIPRKRRWWE